MLNIPESVKTLFKTDGVRKNFRARFPNGELPDITNDDIVQDSVRFTESLCSQDVLKFGLTEASVIEFETVGIGNMYGLQIECFCEVDTSSFSAAELASAGAEGYDGELVPAADSDLGYGFYRVPYGSFRVESCPRNHEAMARRKVTGYSKSFASLAKSLPGLPDQLDTERLLADPAALLAQAESTNLAKETFAYYDYAGIMTRAPVYDETGTAFYIELGERATVGSPPTDAIVSYSGAQSAGIPSADFFSASFSYDADQHYAFGKAIAEALTAAGYSFIYNNKKQAVFDSNEEALLNAYPHMFFPVVAAAPQHWETDSITGTYADVPYGGIAYWQKAEPDKLYPLIHCGTGNSKYAFFDPTKNTDPDYQWGFHRFGESNSGNGVNTIYLSRAADDRDIYTRVTMPATIKTPVVELLTDTTSLHAYTLQTRSSHRLSVPSSGDGSPTFIQEELQGSLKALQKYSFTLDIESVLDGYLEWGAYFGKIDRHGQLGHFHLSKDNPVALSPVDYSNFWLDEYDIESIGAVRYPYETEDGLQEVLYRFGAGASVYDMTDNAALKLLDGASQKSIESLLKSSFRPYLSAVNFTPIDLSMKGLPHLEAGDYLTITGQDGSEVFSFNMRQELTGEQVLSAEVSSVSGEILEEV